MHSQECVHPFFAFNMMKDYITSELTGITYAAQDVVRIVNPRQSAFYVYNNIKCLDNYLSLDRYTDDPIWVWIFNKKDTVNVYDEWCKKKNEISSQ